MEVGPRDVYEKQFNDAWRGYDQEEVDDFLDKVAEALDETQRENADLTERVRTLEESVATAREAEEMLRTTLATAQQAAEEAMAKAKSKADQLIGEAEERARASTDEAHERVASLESDLKRKARESERHLEQRTRELGDSIARLEAREGELKRKLKEFLEREQVALEALADHAAAPPGGAPEPHEASVEQSREAPRRVVRISEAAQAVAAGGPDAATQEHDVLIGTDFPDFQPSEDPELEPEYEHQRRGFRSLFHRDEE
jgi:cell division initiation protein